MDGDEWTMSSVLLELWYLLGEDHSKFLALAWFTKLLLTPWIQKGRLDSECSLNSSRHVFLTAAYLCLLMPFQYDNPVQLPPISSFSPSLALQSSVLPGIQLLLPSAPPSPHLRAPKPRRVDVRAPPPNPGQKCPPKQLNGVEGQTRVHIHRVLNTESSEFLAG